MEFDFNKFVNKLREKGLSKQETVQHIYDEIRQAENQKVNFLDQAKENPGFYNYLSSQIDNYIIYLKTLHNNIASAASSVPDEQVYKLEEAILSRTLQLMKQLEQKADSRLGRDNQKN